MKRNIDNCNLIRLLVTKPEFKEGRCSGYCISTGTLCETCKRCEWNQHFQPLKRNIVQKQIKKKSKNTELRLFAKLNEVRIYEIGQYMGISESSMSRKLRYELSPYDKELFIEAVEQLRRTKSLVELKTIQEMIKKGKDKL